MTKEVLNRAPKKTPKPQEKPSDKTDIDVDETPLTRDKYKDAPPGFHLHSSGDEGDIYISNGDGDSQWCGDDG